MLASEPGATLSYTATGLPPGLEIDPTTGVISGTISAGDAVNGPYYSPAVTVSDGTYSATATANWTVWDGTSAPPTIISPGAQVNVVGDFVTLVVSASDTDGGSLIFDATNLPDGLTMDPLSGIISGTVDTDAVSATPYAVTLYATDFGNDTVASQTISWIVNDSNLTISPASILAVTGNNETFTVATFTNSNPNWYEGDFTASIVWGDGTATDVGDISGENGSFTVTGNHTYENPGSFTPIVTITDGFQTISNSGGSASVSLAPLSTTGGFRAGGDRWR